MRKGLAAYQKARREYVAGDESAIERMTAAMTPAVARTIATIERDAALARAQRRERELAAAAARQDDDDLSVWGFLTLVLIGGVVALLVSLVVGTTSHSYGKPFGYRHKPGTCRWCGDKLRKAWPDSQGTGYNENGKFCSLRCGYQWAVRAAP